MGRIERTDVVGAQALGLRRALWATAAVLTVITLVHGTVGLGSARAADTWQLWGETALNAVPASLLVLRAALVRRDRAAWWCIAIAFTLWLGWYVAFVTAADDSPPSGVAVADLFWLPFFYPLLYVGLALLARTRFRALARRSLWADGVIGTLALGALGALVLAQVVDGDLSHPSAVLLAYPLGDLLLLGVVLTIFAVSGWRPGRNWMLVLLALLLEIVADVEYVRRSLEGLDVLGTARDLLWPVVGLLFAYAAWRPDDEPSLEPPRQDWRVAAAPIGFTAVAVVVLVYERTSGGNDVAFLLALGAVVAGFVRTAASVGEVRAAEAGRRSLVRSRLVLEAVGDAVLGVDRDGRITSANAAAAALSVAPADGLVGRDVTALLSDGDAVAAVRRTLADGEPRRLIDQEWVREGGERVAVDLVVTPLREGTTVEGAVLAVKDVTQRREVQRAKDEFTSVVSHELRTPLTSIRGSLGLLAGGALGELPPGARRMVEIAAQSSDRLLRLINDMLDVERLEAGRVRLDRQECDSAALVHEAVVTMQALADSHEVALRLDVESAPLWVDPDRLGQALTNLLANAVKFSPRGGTVVVGARRRDREVVFSVSDQGRGIPADRLEVVFERFGQVDSSDSRERGGTGLGLTISKALVEQHGGRIWVESEPGRGSTFRFTLPVSPASTEARPAAPLASAPTEGALVVVCDDDSLARHGIGALLAGLGHRVVAVESAQEAVDAVRRLRPDLLLLDLVMSPTSGWETAGLLTRDAETSGVPVVVLSVLPRQDADVPVGNVVGWLQKPATRESLRAAVDAALAPTPQRLRSPAQAR